MKNTQPSHVIGNGLILASVCGASLEIHGSPLYAVRNIGIHHTDLVGLECTVGRTEKGGLFTSVCRKMSHEPVFSARDVIDKVRAIFLRAIECVCETRLEVTVPPGMTLSDLPGCIVGGRPVHRLIITPDTAVYGSAYDCGRTALYLFGRCGYDSVRRCIFIHPGRSYIAASCGTPEGCARELAHMLRRLDAADGDIDECEAAKGSAKFRTQLMSDLALSVKNSCDPVVFGVISEALELVSAHQAANGAVVSLGEPLTADTLTQAAACELFAVCGRFEEAKRVMEFLSGRTRYSGGEGLLYGEPSGFCGLRRSAVNGASVVPAAVMLAALRLISGVDYYDISQGRVQPEKVEESNIVRCELMLKLKPMLDLLAAKQLSALRRSTLPFGGFELPFRLGLVPKELCASASALSSALMLASGNGYVGLYGDDGMGRYTAELKRIKSEYARNFTSNDAFAASNPAIIHRLPRYTFGRCPSCGADAWLERMGASPHLCAVCLESNRESKKARNANRHTDIPDYGCAYPMSLLLGTGVINEHESFENDCGIDSCHAHALRLRVTKAAGDAAKIAAKYSDGRFPEYSLFGCEYDGMTLRCASVIGAALADFARK